MLNSNHPDDERLSALASHDTDARADTSLTGHVSSCDRCTDLVNELGALRASLAELPDIVPSRPLRLLPEVAASPSSAGWMRRIFAPMLTAGAALALVGMVGTSMPALDGMASGGADQGEDAAAEELGGAAPDAAGGNNGESVDDLDTQRSAEPGASSESHAFGGEGDIEDGGSDVGTAGVDEGDERRLARELPAERSPWPMVLFTGVAVMILAALLRWVLVPRAG